MSRNTRSAALKTIAVAALLALLGLAGYALAKSSGPPTPTITPHPANPTNSTSASFTFSDSQAGVSYTCSLDGSSSSACASPKSYPGLTQGSHTFQVEAVSGAQASSAASFTSRIDLSPPSVAITFPANGGVYSATGWTAGCPSAPGVCGSASDPSGVSAVALSIKQNATGKYWNQATPGYSSATELYNAATTSATTTGADWRYSLPLPSPDGGYTVHVRATDGLGNQTAAASPASSAFSIDTTPPPAPAITSHPANPTNQTNASFSFTDGETGVSYRCKLDLGAYSICASPKAYTGLSNGTHSFSVEAADTAGNISAATGYSWTVDTIPPPAPTITSHPPDPSTSTSATFSFVDLELGVGFQCKLDSQAWQSCTSPVTYTGLSVSSHAFGVRAYDAAGNFSSVASYSWSIPNHAQFFVSGNAQGLLVPGGPARPIPVTVSNPNSVAIYVTSLTGSVLSSSLPAGCTANGFQVSPSSASTATPLKVPANGSVTLPAQGITAPSIQMLDLSTSQDACKTIRLTLSYGGSAHS
jgi:hypothetical protein